MHSPAPIVLAHGIARFDKLTDMVLGLDNNDETDAKHYFKNVRTHLRSHGLDVWHTNVAWAASVTKRASDLKREIEAVLARTGAERLHIIAHSMGGLDARHMLFDNRESGLHRRIASVTTIATPHLGSPMADFVLDPVGFFSRPGVEAVGGSDAEGERARPEDSQEYADFARLFETSPEGEGLERGGVRPEGLGDRADLAGIADLRTEAAKRFNARAEEWEASSGVPIRTYAGAQPLAEIFFPLRLSWRIIQQAEGDNDGLVSVESARFRSEYFRETLAADHLNELGWWPDVASAAEREAKEKSSLAFYLELAQSLESLRRD